MNNQQKKIGKKNIFSKEKRNIFLSQFSSFWGTIQLALKSLTESPLRSGLTALGIIVGTALVIIVLSVGAGVRGLILHQLSDITPESLWIEVQVPSAGTRSQKDASTGEAVASGVQIKTLKIKDMEDLLKLSNIKTGFSVVMGQEKLSYRNNEKRTMFWAVTDQYPQAQSLDIAEGRFFTEREESSLEPVVVIGSDIKKTLFGAGQAIGEKINIGGKLFRVIGIAKPIGTKFFMNMDEVIYLPLRTAQKKILGYDYLAAISLIMKDSTFLQQTVSSAQYLLRKNHHIKNPEKDDFVVRTMDESMDIVNTVTGGISLLLFSLASISLLVGGVGIMNIMYVVVTERTKEIGVKKAIGASPFLIRLQFLSEAIILSVLGGLMGICIGVALSYFVSVIAGLFDINWSFIIPIHAVALAFGTSVGIGILFGYAPAGKAAKMNPVDAMRSV